MQRGPPTICSAHTLHRSQLLSTRLDGLCVSSSSATWMSRIHVNADCTSWGRSARLATAVRADHRIAVTAPIQNVQTDHVVVTPRVRWSEARVTYRARMAALPGDADGGYALTPLTRERLSRRRRGHAFVALRTLDALVCHSLSSLASRASRQSEQPVSLNRPCSHSPRSGSTSASPISGYMSTSAIPSYMSPSSCPAASSFELRSSYGLNGTRVSPSALAPRTTGTLTLIVASGGSVICP